MRKLKCKMRNFPLCRPLTDTGVRRVISPGGLVVFPAVFPIKVLAAAVLSAAAFHVQAEGICERTPQVQEAIWESHRIGYSNYWIGFYYRWISPYEEQDCEYVTSEDLSEIERLDLSRRGISTLKADDFEGLSNLQTLHLDRNQLSTLPATVFSGLDNLQELLLFGNHLSTLPATVFSGLGNIRTLFLSHNRLSTLPATVFSGLDTLEELILPGNRLSTLPATVFENLNRLRFLSLRDNGIEALPATAFAGLHSLLSLRLHQNELSALPPRVFADLGALRDLYLHDNQLDTLPTTVFASLSRLEELNLSSNHLTTLSATVFSSLGGLEELNLSSNRLTTLPDGVFAGLHRLRSLWLHNNPGAPFNLQVEFKRLNEQNPAASFARFRLTMSKGAPGEVTVPLTARGGVVFPDHAVFSAGNTQSDMITVSRSPARPTTISASSAVLIETCGGIWWRPCYEGFRTTVDFRFTLEAIPSPNLSFANTLVEADEGGMAEIALHWTQQHSSTITVGYSVGRDNNQHTNDADEQDYIVDGSTGVVTIAPDATTATIRIPIRDDNDTEPFSKWFTVSLTAPDANAGYVLGSLTTAAVVIKENICDRTQQVQDKILSRFWTQDCRDVTSRDLSGITELEFRGLTDELDGLDELERLEILEEWEGWEPIQTLKENDFAGLSDLGSLDLTGNQLTTLPDGIFEGLRSLRMLWMYRNPGTFFNLEVGFEPIGTPSAASTFTEVRFTLREGAPGYITIPLTVDGGTLSRDQVSLLTGSTQSEVVTVTRNSWSTVTVTPNPSPPRQTCDPGYYPCYRGIRIVAGDLPVLGASYFTLSLESTKVEVEEGETAEIIVKLPLQQLPTLTVNYRIGKDNDKHTADADSEDYSTELVTIAPGANSAAIRIPITDDGDIEPTSETLTVSLTVSGDGEAHVLGSPAISTVVIREGVCDRTSVMQSVVMGALSKDDCADVTSVDLANLKESLNLRGQGIAALKQGDFSGLVNLKILRLDRNDLTALAPGVFSGLRSLQELHLDSNQLTDLAPGVFSGLGNLEILYLFRNELSGELNARVFSELSSLRELYLYSNNLTSLAPGVFSGLGNLEILDLSSNYLAELPTDVFSDLQNLQDLHLDSNDLGELPERIFSGLFHLEKLSLNNNFNSDNNSGSPFRLTLQFNDVQSSSSDSNPAKVRLIMDESAPFDITTDLLVERGTVSATEVTLPRGKAASGTFDLYQSGSLPVIVSMSDELVVQNADDYSGLTITTGDPFAFDKKGPAVSGVEFVSEPSQGDSYLVSSNETPPSLWLAVSFNEEVLVSVSASSPVLALGFDETTRMASYDQNSSSTDRLVFHHQLTMDDFDTDGVSIAEDALRPNGATLKDAEGNEAKLNLGTYAISNAAAHKVYRQSELSLATTLVEIVEGATALLTVSAVPPPHVDLNAGYYLSGGGSGRDYSRLRIGSVSISAGASTGTMRIPIADNVTIEPPHEFLTVTLTPPSPSTAYLLAFPATATVVVKEGICDRTQDVQDGILDRIFAGAGFSTAMLRENCPDVTGEELASLMGKLDINRQQEGAGSLKEKDFEGFTGITSLFLNGNQISKLPPGVFGDLMNLKELILWNNRLAELPPGLFAGLTHLQSLNLGSNELVELPPGLFAGLTNLQSLNLGSNELAELPPGLFAGLTSLQELELDDNQLSGLPAGLFEGLTGLTKVWLHRNPKQSEKPLELTSRFEMVKLASESTPGTFHLKLAVNEGAPFEINAIVSLYNATLSSMLVTIPTGSTVSDAFTVTQRDAATQIIVYSNSSPPVPDIFCGLYDQCYQGVDLSKPESLSLNQRQSSSEHQYAAPLLTLLPPDSPPPISASLVFSPSTQIQVEQGRSTTFGVSVSPALVLGEALSLRLAIWEDENQAANGVTFAGSSSVRLTFDGGSSARERQVPVSASATAVIGTTAPVFADEVAALGISLVGKLPLLELSVTTPRVAVSFTPEALPPLEVGSSVTVSLSLRDYELQPGQQAKLQVQMFGVGWSVYPATVTLAAETPVAKVSLRASDEATFGVLRVTALEGVELLREAVLKVQAGQ